MIKKIIDKRNYILYTLIIILFLFILITNQTKIKATTKTYNYFNEKIVIELYTNKNTNKAFKNINNIYKKYHKFYTNPNKNNNKELIELLKYGKKLYKKTNGYIDITSYKLLANIKENKQYTFKTSINTLDFKNKNTLVNINIENIIDAYATKKVEEYLHKIKINSYIIKQDNNIVIGKSYNNKKYNIPIVINHNIINILSLENKSIAIKKNTKALKPYMINPITSTKTNDKKLVAVIASDINEANYIANTIYLMKNDEIEKYVKKYKVEALWYNGDKPLKTKGFKKYELKH
ncbi:MAG: FAD:protein FMN transferase [Bacilli bacterium]|nr:FAD:protein FMN transferase [Bacilli bacterium]